MAPLLKIQSRRPARLVPERVLAPALCLSLLLVVEMHAGAASREANEGIRYGIRTYRLEGVTVLSQSDVDSLTAEGRGSSVDLGQVRLALRRLQTALRQRGIPDATLNLPRQTMEDGVVIVRAATGTVQETYELKHFEVRGNTALSPEEIDRLIGPLADAPVSVREIEQRLSALRSAYRDRGLSRASVSIKPQVLADGVAVIDVDEGRLTPLPQVASSAPPAPRTFEVRSYDVAGNTLLKADQVSELLREGIGAHVTLPQIQTALGRLQLAYRERGFATVSVGLPQQQLTNGVVKVQVTEGVVTGIRVMGNHHFSSNNVVRALPSLATNGPLNSKVLQRELDAANQNRDRQIYPTITPGPDPGASILVLRVKDRPPLHGRIEVNNHSTPGTPEWRVNSSLSYGNLWQREHQLGLSYGFTPEAFKSPGPVSDVLLNRPLIANYGAYYRLPFGEPESVQGRIERSEGRFGYDEATHQFRLPPAEGRPDLTVYWSGSSSDTGVKYTPASMVSQTPLLTIQSRDSGQNLTFNSVVGARYSHPFTLDERRRFSVSAGLDGKLYSLESRNTNNFFITTVVTNALGSQTIESVVASPQPTRKTELAYLPLSLGADFSRTDRTGFTAIGLTLSGNAVGDDADFGAAGAHARAMHGRAVFNVTRDQRLFGQWSLWTRAAAQAATGPLISNEQFAVGGLSSVRGYYEGDQYGDAGWFGSAELRTPLLNTDVPLGSDSAPAWLRGVAFVDVAQRFSMQSGGPSDPFRTLAGAGVGLSASVNDHFDARITLAVPLTDSANTQARDARLYFQVGGQF